MSKHGEQVGSIPLWPGLQFLPRAPILTSLHDGLRCEISPFSPKLLSVRVLSQRQKWDRQWSHPWVEPSGLHHFPRLCNSVQSSWILELSKWIIGEEASGFIGVDLGFLKGLGSWDSSYGIINHASLGLHPLIISCPGHTHSISCFLFCSFQCHPNTSTAEPSLITLCRQRPPHGWLVLITYSTWWKPEWRQTWWGHPNHCWGEWAGKQSYKCVYVCVHYRRKILGEKVDFTLPSKQPTEMIWVYT